MEVYLIQVGNDWFIVNNEGEFFTNRYFRKYHKAEDYCIDRGWIICEYAND